MVLNYKNGNLDWCRWLYLVQVCHWGLVLWSVERQFLGPDKLTCWLVLAGHTLLLARHVLIFLVRGEDPRWFTPALTSDFLFLRRPPPFTPHPSTNQILWSSQAMRHHMVGWHLPGNWSNSQAPAQVNGLNNLVIVSRCPVGAVYGFGVLYPLCLHFSLNIWQPFYHSSMGSYDYDQQG